MTPRTLTFVILAASLALGSPVSAKDKPAKAERTWKMVIDYVLANGTERKLQLPTTKLLGFESEEIATKALRYKSDDAPDKIGHAVYVVLIQDKDGNTLPHEIVLGSRAAVIKDGVKSINHFLVRTDLNGKIISAASIKGPADHFIEKTLLPESKEAIAGHKSELEIHLRTMDLQKLTK